MRGAGRPGLRAHAGSSFVEKIRRSHVRSKKSKYARCAPRRLATALRQLLEPCKPRTRGLWAHSVRWRGCAFPALAPCPCATFVVWPSVRCHTRLQLAHRGRSTDACALPLRSEAEGFAGAWFSAQVERAPHGSAGHVEVRYAEVRNARSGLVDAKRVEYVL